MKTYLAADPGRERIENLITGEIIPTPAVNTRLTLGHDIWFGDTLVLYTNPADIVGSALQKDSDYILESQDSIATDQSGSVCYSQIVLLTAHPFVYANYHAYGDFVTNEFVTVISNLSETLDPRVTALEANDETQDGILFLHGQRLSNLENTTGSQAVELSNHEGRLSAAESGLSGTTEALVSLSGTVMPIPGQIEDLQTTTTDHETRIDSAESTIATHGVELSNHETRLAAVESEVVTEISAEHLAYLMASQPAIGAIIAFDANNPGPIVNAGAFIVGRQYKIATVGTTNWVAIGAPSNTVGVTFTATGAGNGNGNARDLKYATGEWVDNTTMLGWYACVPGNAQFGCPDLSANAYLTGKVVAGAAGALVGTNSYSLSVSQLPAHSHPGSSSNSVGTGVSTQAETADHSHGSPNGGFIGPTGGNVGSGTTPNIWSGATNTGGRSASHTHVMTDPAHSHTITVASQGSGTALDNRPSSFQVIWVRKCA